MAEVRNMNFIRNQSVPMVTEKSVLSKRSGYYNARHIRIDQIKYIVDRKWLVKSTAGSFHCRPFVYTLSRL